MIVGILLNGDLTKAKGAFYGAWLGCTVSFNSVIDEVLILKLLMMVL